MEDALEITGYANVVERDSAVLKAAASPRAPGPFVERVKAGAFRRAIQAGPDISLKVDHKRYIGSVKDGTLLLAEDGIGLKVTVRTRDKELVRAASARKIRGWSFGFGAAADTWALMENGIYRRTLRSFDLREISILIDAKPAYAATSAEVKGNSVLVENRAWELSGDPAITALKAKGLLTAINQPK